MQIPIVMILALSGLGCQNRVGELIDSPMLPGHQIDTQPFTTSQQSGGAAITSAESFASSPYPQIGARVYARYSSYEPTDWRAECRKTLYSFVWGRDPDVATAREIEASVYGSQSEH